MTSLPTATIVIPAYNRPERLAACLSGIATLNYPADRLTVEIVDDGSVSPLAPVATAVASPFGTRVTRTPNRGPAAARNSGASLATGDLLAFTDDDCLPDRNWIMALADAFARSPDALIGGKVENGVIGNIFADASQDLVDFLYDYFDAARGGAPFFTSNNLACSRQHFVDSGGFDESFPLAAAEDRELGIRWRRQGRPLVFEPAALMHHHHDLNLARFWRQHRNYGIGARHLHKVLRESGDRRPPIENLVFYARLVTYPMSARKRSGVARSALMLLSQFAMTRGFAHGGTQRKLM